MADLWGIQVMLITGETRWLSESWGTAEEVGDKVNDFVARRGAFRSEWLDTSVPSMIARAHIVEFGAAPAPSQGS